MSWPGSLLALAGSISILGTITAEGLFPASVTYTTAASTLSRLGTDGAAPHSIVFNGSVASAGLLFLLTATLLWRDSSTGLQPPAPRLTRVVRQRVVPALLVLLAVGYLMVAFFPTQFTIPHYTGALIAFFTGPLLALATIPLVRAPLRLLAVLAALAAVIAIAVSPSAIPAGLFGLSERWIVYPITLYLIAFGGHLATTTTNPRPQ